MSNVHPIHKLLMQHRKCKVGCDVSKLGSIAVQTGKLPVCRPGIVPGQKYSPATECVVLVGRIGAGAACLPAWSLPQAAGHPIIPSSHRVPAYKFLPPICLHFSSFTHVQPAITLHPKDWNYCETICLLSSTIQKLLRNLAKKFGNGNVYQCTVLQKVCPQSACKPTYQ